jgi:hypothetical protein
VTIEPDELSIERSCGALTGAWRADASGLFVGHVFGSTGCQLPIEPAPGWLLRAAAFRLDGTDRLLVAPDGTVAARLRPVASPDAPPPTPTDQQRREYGAPAALPRNLVPAGRQALIGRWLPAGSMSTDRPNLEFLADTAWRGSDGCNGHGGRWVTGADGALLGSGGPSTDMGCPGVPVGAWMADVRRAGLDGGRWSCSISTARRSAASGVTNDHAGTRAGQASSAIPPPSWYRCGGQRQGAITRTALRAARPQAPQQHAGRAGRLRRPRTIRGRSVQPMDRQRRAAHRR